MLSTARYNPEPRKLWRNFDHAIEIQRYRSQMKPALLALIPSQPYPPCKTNPKMDDILALGKLFIGVCSCFNNLDTAEKKEVADFIEHFSKEFSTGVVSKKDTQHIRLYRKITTLMQALRSPEGCIDPTFVKVQEIFSHYKDSPWTRGQKEEVDRLFSEGPLVC